MSVRISLTQLVRSAAMVAATVTVVGCASSSPRPASVQSSASDYVTSVEIAAIGATNAYDLINRLRPRWLRTQAPGSISGGVRSQVIAVYLDGVRLGGLDALRSLSTTGFQSMRYYDATRAATVLRDPGSEPIAGAIVITTNRG
jgi:hypothetical protein